MRALIIGLGISILALAQSAIAADFPQVRMETTAGNFVIELDESRAPLTVANFLQYVNDGFYEGTIFHRIINNFVIQGGGLTASFEPKATRPAIPNESGNGLQNRRMSVALARTGDPHSGDSQFYINLGNNADLDPKPTRWGYAVFGRIVEGIDVVDEIGYRPTGPGGPKDKDGRPLFSDVPAAPVIIERAVLVTAD